VTSPEPRLTVATVTAAPPGRLAAFLSAWRDAADELVVAVDERAEPGTAEAARLYADVVAVVPAMPHMERALGWVHARCRGAWILRADDDELPSDGLLSALPSLLDERELTHVWLPRVWPHPTPDEAIADGAWGRDIQVRLVRNLPGLWRFSGRLHTNIEVLGASRIADAGLLHVVNLLHDADARRRRRAAYEARGATLVDETGRPLNEVYTPEDAGELQRVPLPPADARRIRAFLAAAGGPTAVADAARGAGPPIERPSVAELEAWLDDRVLRDSAPRARVRLVDPVPPIPAEGVRHVTVEVTNLGPEWWPRGPWPEPPLAMGTRWLRPDGTEIVLATARTAFTERVAPGARTRLTVAVQAPQEVGDLEVLVGVVHEGVAWLEEPARQTVRVTNPST
jgi:hypothetical protein